MSRRGPVILGIFVREPVAGKVKRRLAKDLGPDRACELYMEFVRSTLKIARRSRLPFAVFCSPPSSADRLRRRFQIVEPIVGQNGRSLGARMRNAVRFILKSTGAALLIGSDSPTLPARFLTNARHALKSNDLVLGPARDGGYYLIGIRRPAFRKAQHRLFSRIQWGGPDVFRLTLDRARKSNFRVHLLPPWSDIDTADDLRHAGWAKKFFK